MWVPDFELGHATLCDGQRHLCLNREHAWNEETVSCLEIHWIAHPRQTNSYLHCMASKQFSGSRSPVKIGLIFKHHMDLGFQRFLTGERILFWCATGRVTNLRCFPALTRGEAVNIHIKGHLTSYFSVLLKYFSWVQLWKKKKPRRRSPGSCDSNTTFRQQLIVMSVWAVPTSVCWARWQLCGRVKQVPSHS